MIPPCLPGNRNPPHIDRTDRQEQGREPISPLVLSPLHPQKVKHWLCSSQPPTPPIAAFVGPSARMAPGGFHHCPSLWFAPGSFVPSFLLRLQLSLPRLLFCHLLRPSSPASLPARASGREDSRAGTFPPAQDAQTVAPRSWRSGAERCRRMRGGVV